MVNYSENGYGLSSDIIMSPKHDTFPSFGVSKVKKPQTKFELSNSEIIKPCFEVYPINNFQQS